ncbi:uncharacterized protein LOC131882415 [Tigriopus californicus]|uniref:uncharacterized protein LOC131882415 n=1 Tax=Tigriopus californicus TaxID=6832 RepID=UPI0027D9E2AB|nr:uncharacterized protein LOC131882415 [Tigriopus californicus]
MQSIAILALAFGLATAGTISNYPSMPSGGGGSGSGGYGGSDGGSGGYGGGYEKPKCRDVYDTVQENQCEPYTERVCQTTQKETCQDVADQNCRAITTTKQIRKCFDVSENICSLKEQVKFDTIQVGFTVQKCRKVKERVCDTVYETQMTTKEDFQCLEIENPVCVNEERAIVDKTCRTTTQFDCKQTGGGYGSGSSSGYGSSGNAFGSDSSSSGGYGSGSSSSGGYGDSSSSSGGYGGEVEQPQVVCNRRQETKCYDTPRTVNVQRCTRKAEKVCEKVTLLSPVAQERQNCRNEDKKVCELEERTQPKQVKNYVYTKQCNPVPRRMCENADVAQLVPSCVASTRKQCSYSPVEACEDTPKQHCFKVSRQVRRQVCDGSNGSGNQGSGMTSSFANAMGFGSSDGNDFSSGFASSGFGGSSSSGSAFSSGSHGVGSSSSTSGGSTGFESEY